jgi:hypothetical protein
MNIRRLSFGLSCLFFSFTAFSQDQNYRPAHIGFCYPLSTNGTAAPAIRNGASVHVLVGVSSAEDAFCASGIGAIVKDSAKGVLASALFNYVGGKSTAAVLSGCTGVVKGKVSGLQASGFNSYAGSVDGCQLSGFLNVVQSDIKGVQGAGFANIAQNSGPQFSGFFNVAQSVTAIQASGFGNVSRAINGVQASGFMNVADSVGGAQIAGFINVARKVKGAQIAGLINIADSCEYPIGLINIIGNGERWLGLQYDETGTALLSFRSGSKRIYGILSAGINPAESDLRYALEGGMGMHAFSKGIFRIKTELTITSITRFNDGVFMRSSLRLLPSLRLARFVELYGGVSLGFVNTPQSNAFNPELPFFWERRSRGTFYGISAGALAGLHFSF